MKIWKLAALSAALFASLALCLPDDAEARRMGGGRSFGGSGITRSAPAPKAPAGAVQPGTNMNRQSNLGAGAGAAAAAPAVGGMFGGMGGMFGGFLAGSLLGSMLFGGSSAAAGAGAAGSAGFGMFDLLLLGGLGYLAYRMFSRRRQNQDTTQNSHAQYNRQSNASSNAPGGAWDHLSSKPAAATPQSTATSTFPGFNEEEFLRGAKMAYVRMQESWDKRDLDDIANFATENVMKVIKEQAVEDPKPSTTELLLVNASVMEASIQDNHETVRVFFDVLMREEANSQQSEQVKEIWHFARPVGSNAMWKLDAIQQTY